MEDRKAHRSAKVTIQFKIREANLLYLSSARIILSMNQLVVRLSTARKHLYSTTNLFLNSDGYLQLMRTILYIFGRIMEKFGSQIYCFEVEIYPEKLQMSFLMHSRMEEFQWRTSPSSSRTQER